MSTPISLELFELAISDLPDDTVKAVKFQLENSVFKLKSSNEELKHEMEETEAKMQNLPKERNSEELVGDLKLYSETICENMAVIENKIERLSAVEIELSKRVVTTNTENTTETNELIL